VTTLNSTIDSDRQIERRINYTQKILVALLLIVIIVPFLASWWIARQYPAISTVTFDNLQVVGESALCPGQPLIISYDFHAGGSGVLVRDATVWRLVPPRTIIFSTSRRFILDGPIEQHLNEAWHIPVHYLNPETDKVELIPPGDYKRIVAISSPSASRIVAIGSVNFSIKEGC
jgi:hypothetical protein